MKKMNCWEYKRCGREIGGHNNKVLKICPAAMTKELHKTHGGTHAGRACWVVAGTMCGGEPQGTFAQKYGNCEKCDFYHKVKEEEGMNFLLSIVLINKMTATTSPTPSSSPKNTAERQNQDDRPIV